MVLGYTEKMFTVYGQLQTTLLADNHPKERVFRIGVCQYVSTRFAFDLMSLLSRAELSDASCIQIIQDDASTLFEAFVDHRLDVLLGAIGPVFTKGKRITNRRFSFPVRIFSPAHKLFSESDVESGLSATAGPGEILAIANQKNLMLALPMSGSALRTETDSFLSTFGIAPKRTIECNNAAGIVHLIERGCAFGFLPHNFLLDICNPQDVEVLGSEEGYWCHELAVATHDQKEKENIQGRSLSSARGSVANSSYNLQFP